MDNKWAGDQENDGQRENDESDVSEQHVDFEWEVGGLNFTVLTWNLLFS